jgi:GAF domain-containing protein/HAMP domain-containing protein
MIDQKRGMENAQRPRPTARWHIAQKLALASVLTILLIALTGGVSLWRVLAIEEAMKNVRRKEQQLAYSLELMAAGHSLVAALDHMLLVEDSRLASMGVATSVGTLNFYMSVLQEYGDEVGAADTLAEVRGVYDELRQAVTEVDVLARQERWEEATEVVEQQVRPANEHLAMLSRRLVRQMDLDVEAVAAQAQEVVRQATLQLAVLIFLATALALAWRQFVFRGLSISISDLRQGVARISGGDLDYRLGIRTNDEIEELSYEFNLMADRLTGLVGPLEQRVADRTRGLQAAAEVSRATISVLDTDELLRQAVDLVRERFDLYYAGLFLLDEDGRFAVLQAGTGKAGEEMLARGHRLEVGGDSMIGQCTARAEARIALDVGEEAVRFDNPLLPETRSEMALPLRSRGRVIGAMSVQSAEEAAFDEADVAVLQTMADQVAVAIDNARLFARAQAALEDMEATHRRYLGQAWAEYLQSAEATGYETGSPDGMLLDDAILPEIYQAVQRSGATVVAGNGGEKASHSQPDSCPRVPSTVVAPITLRGKAIGVLGVCDDDPERQWSEDETDLVQAVAERMALAADNLRLVDETQRRAAREQLAGEVTARMRETLDLETVLRTAVEEMYRGLNLDEVVIRLASGEADN